MSQQRGSALLTVLLLTFLFAAVAIAAAVVVRVEILVASQHRHAAEALAGAEAGLEAALSELRGLADWSPVVAGSSRSVLSDGAFAGSKGVPGAGAVQVCCGPGSAADRLETETRLSPLPARRVLQWRPFLWTALDGLAPRDPPSRVFVIVWVANDEDDRAGGAAADTNGTVIVRSEALEPNGVRRIAEAVVARQPIDAGGSTAAAEERRMRIAWVRWREVR